MIDRPTLRRYRFTAEPYEGWSAEQRLKEPYIDNDGDLEEWSCWEDLDMDKTYEMVPAEDYDAQVDAGMKLFEENERLRARIAELEGRVQKLIAAREVSAEASATLRDESIAKSERIRKLEAALQYCIDADAEPYGGSVRADAIYNARQLLAPEEYPPEDRKGEPT